MPHPSRVCMTGALVPHQAALWAELLARGYAISSATGVMQVAAHLSRWLDDEQLAASDLSPVRIAAYLQDRAARGYRRWLTPRGLAPILDPLRIVGAVPPAHAPAAGAESPLGWLFQEYESYVLEERGLRARTAVQYLRVVRSFVESLRLSDLSGLERLSTDVVSHFFLREAPSSSVAHLKVKVTALRSFLRYLHVRGFCRDLSAAVPAVAGYRLCGLPKAMPEEEVRRLLESCDRETAAGRRDFAILLLLSRLGLRSFEVAGLDLDDVRWTGGEILIRGKGSEGLLPLPQDVGEALGAYVKRGRPASTARRLFLQIRAPHRHLTPGAVRALVRRACQRAGVFPAGSHCLRHAAATGMLRKGASLPDIAQVLRHRSLETTAIYAKVDRQALRTVARLWPGGTT